MHLNETDIVGRRLVRILQTYQLLDDWIHFTQNYFVLDSGNAFVFPFDAESPFSSIDVPDDAEEIVHPAIHKAIGSAIDAVYRPRKDDYLEPDDIVLHLDSGLWMWQLSSGPDGVQGSVGVYIEDDPPDGLAEMVPYWSEDEAEPTDEREPE